ncbi:MAG: cell division protein FtsQ/DivIB [Actinomycetota bacterium]
MSRPRREPKRVRTDPRISRRRRAIARARARRWLVVGSLLLAAGTGAWATLWSPLLRVRAVVVVGGDHTSSAEVARAAELDDDDNLLFVSTRAVARAAQSLPWVEDAVVQRRLPSTVRVVISEREPALILLSSGSRWTIDGGGRVLSVGEAEPGLPVLAGVDIPRIEPGLRLKEEAVTDALLAWRSLPRKIKKQVIGVFAPTIERISFSLASGTVIRYGSAEQVRAKNEVVAALMKRLGWERQSVSYVDVRVPATPAIGPPLPAPSPTPTPLPRSGR